MIKTKSIKAIGLIENSRNQTRHRKITFIPLLFTHNSVYKVSIRMMFSVCTHDNIIL